MAGATQREVVEEFRRRLQEMRDRLIRTVLATHAELATLEAHQPGSTDEDVPTDLATAVLSWLEGRERHELDEIEASRARLEAGTYGVCEGCGRPIPLARLRALPTARLCRPCQSREEG